MKLLRESLVLGAAFALFFAVVYGTADFVTGQRATRVRVDFEFEQAIPFVAWMLVFYMSIYPLFWLGPFVLRSRHEIRAFIGAMVLITAFAGIGFLLFPAEIAFPPPNVSPNWQALYTFADEWNLDYNLVPSLHVALSIFCVDVYARRGGAVAALLLWAWGLAIASSTVLTHQHHLLDVATGMLLAVVVSRFFYRRWAAAEAMESAVQFPNL